MFSKMFIRGPRCLPYIRSRAGRTWDRVYLICPIHGWDGSFGWTNCCRRVVWGLINIFTLTSDNTCWMASDLMCMYGITTNLSAATVVHWSEGIQLNVACCNSALGIQLNVIACNSPLGIQLNIRCCNSHGLCLDIYTYGMPFSRCWQQSKARMVSWGTGIVSGRKQAFMELEAARKNLRPLNLQWVGFTFACSAHAGF
jgi:hypothetical protein